VTRKFRLEGLEDRYLATAGLSPLSSMTPPATHAAHASSAHIHIEAVLIGGTSSGIADSSATVATLLRGGLRGNHNETLLRDNGSKGRHRHIRRRKR
jgi:hypothetical protein